MAEKIKSDVEPHKLWGARISSAFQLWRNRGWYLTQQLEDSLSGTFPKCAPGASVVAPDASGSTKLWDYSASDQVNYNLNLAAVQYMLAQSWDEFPTLHFASRPKNASEDLILGNEGLATTLMDDADATSECRLGMESAMTRGPLILFFGIGGDTPTAESVSTMAMPVAEIIEAAMHGQPVTLRAGMDYKAISEAAASLIADPAKSAVLGTVVTGNLMDLSAKAAELAKKEYEDNPKAVRRAKIWVQACPYGSWCLWDTTVSDPRKAQWIARKLIYDQEEFENCEAFSAKAKREVLPIVVGESDGWGSVKYATMEPTADAQENKRYVIWEIWDKKHWKVHYIAEGYDGFLEDDDTYPYLDGYGKPVLPNFYPCVVRVPIRSPRERPESSWGIAQLAPGWHMQIEFIKFESKAINSLKQTARIYFAGASVDDATFKEVKDAVDGTIVRGKPGPKEEQAFDKLPFDTPAPKDYQEAAMRCMFRFANAVRVPSVAFTGEPIADTLGQEQIALQGATTTQSDIIRQYESAYAELAWGSLMLFRAFAPDEQVQAYLGPQSTEPRPIPVTDPATGQPQVGPDGQPAVIMGPSLWEEWKSTSLDGHKFAARFASSTRAEDAIKQKMSMDYLMALRGGVTPMGMRLWDETDTMNRLSKGMDMPDPKPYQPSLAEQAAMVMAGGGAGIGGKKEGDGDREGPSGERTDSRTAGGQRGTGQGIKGRQQRHEGPPTRSGMSGTINRAARAKS